MSTESINPNDKDSSITMKDIGECACGTIALAGVCAIPVALLTIGGLGYFANYFPVLPKAASAAIFGLGAAISILAVATLANGTHPG